VLYSDFEKAFDKVPHIRLIFQLYSYGINKTIVKWIQDFLSVRRFRVRINSLYGAWSQVGSLKAVSLVLYYFLIFITI